MSQVLTIDEMVCAADEWRREGAVIVLAAGCWDPVHVGHVQHLKAARAMGNVLVVSVTGDRYVGKGPGRPLMTDSHRAEVLSSVRDVDAVVVNQSANVVGIIEALKPHIFAKGVEYIGNRTPQIEAETVAMAAHGGRVEYVTGRIVCSSSAILAGVTNRLLREYAGT